jgi:hypothetical protein
MKEKGKRRGEGGVIHGDYKVRGMEDRHDLQMYRTSYILSNHASCICSFLLFLCPIRYSCRISN